MDDVAEALVSNACVGAWHSTAIPKALSR